MLAIIDIVGRQLRCENLPGLGIDADMQLAPGPAPPGAVFLDQPLAGSAQTQACAVDQQVNRSSGARIWPWHLQGFGPPAQGRVIWHCEIKAYRSLRIEPIKPSVCRSASRNTARSVRAVLIARAE